MLASFFLNDMYPYVFSILQMEVQQILLPSTAIFARVRVSPMFLFNAISESTCNTPPFNKSMGSVVEALPISYLLYFDLVCSFAGLITITTKLLVLDLD